MPSHFHSLRITAIDYPIADATTITFAVPTELREVFHYHPGQHLVLRFNLEGEEVRRSYSLNSCPFQEEPLQITVKRVKGGLVSNYVGDHLQIGDTVEVMPPQGRFSASVHAADYKTYYLFAAGSGITPIYSILKSVLVASPDSVVYLFYGNTHQDTILFKEALDTLEEQFPTRLQVVHTLSSPKVWTTWQQWKGRTGRIDPAAVEWFINQYPPVAQNTAYYICGPGAMNLSVRQTLLDLGVPKSLLHVEHFGGPIKESSVADAAVDNARVTVSLRGQQYPLSIPKGQTILQALKQTDADPPYSCESGVCGTCVAQVVKGKVAMKACMALEEGEIAKGMVLTCQALPQAAEVDIRY